MLSTYLCTKMYFQEKRKKKYWFSVRVSNGTGWCNFSAQRDRSSFIVQGQRDKLKILPKSGTGRGTKRDTAGKDVLKQENDVLKQKKLF